MPKKSLLKGDFDERRFQCCFRGYWGPKSNFRGIRTWIGFESESDFKQWLIDSGSKNRIVAQGVTRDEVVALAGQTTRRARAEYFLHQARENPVHTLFYYAQALGRVAEEGTLLDFLAVLQDFAADRKA